MFTQENHGNTPSNNIKQHELLAKLLVIGDGGVGKTSLITRFTQQKFIHSYTTTIGVDFKSKIIQCDDIRLKLQIWDTAGQQRFRNITKAYYKGASGIILTFSLIDKNSFENIQKWLVQIDQNAQVQCCKILVGTKSDCTTDRVISRSQAQKLAISMGITYIEASSKTGDQVENIFYYLGKQICNVCRKNIKIANDNNKLKINANNQQQNKILRQGNCKC